MSDRNPPVVSRSGGIFAFLGTSPSSFFITIRWLSLDRRSYCALAFVSDSAIIRTMVTQPGKREKASIINYLFLNELVHRMHDMLVIAQHY